MPRLTTRYAGIIGALTALPALLAITPPAAAQSPALSMARPRAGGAPTAADSVANVLRARVMQRQFEQTRRAYLPIASFYPADRCEVRVGRFCWWSDESESPPAEPPRIATERARFLVRLAEAGERSPRDEWILGQRVRYMVEDGHATDAARLAGSCGAVPRDTAAASGDSLDAPAARTRRWCDALLGFALHAAGSYAGSDSAFGRALDASSEGERCEWLDLTVLLDGGPAKRYRALPCPARAQFERRFWELARPLYVLDANDLRTEHLARQVMARLDRDARDAHDMVWGDDVHELLTRFGWATHWSRTLPSAMDPTVVHVVGHEPTPSFDFVPADEALDDPWRAGADQWAPKDRDVRARYAPRWGTAIAEPPHQIAFFRRGDSAVVVAAIDLRADTLFRRDTVRAALALLSPSADSAVIVRADGAPRLARLSARISWGPALASVEALDSASRHAARARHGVKPPAPDSGSSLGISDVLLLERADSLPASLEDAGTLARGAARIRDDRVGAFWEIYPGGLGDSTIRYTLTVKPLDDNALHRLARRVGLAKAKEPVRMEWEEPLATLPIVPRSLAIDLSGLPNGRYAMTLLATTGSATARASREVEIVR